VSAAQDDPPDTWIEPIRLRPLVGGGSPTDTEVAELRLVAGAIASRLPGGPTKAIVGDVSAFRVGQCSGSAGVASYAVSRAGLLPAASCQVETKARGAPRSHSYPNAGRRSRSSSVMSSIGHSVAAALADFVNPDDDMRIARPAPAAVIEPNSRRTAPTDTRLRRL
jgi:hypothetical protein